jgi:AraC-like DNA-binding protein
MDYREHPVPETLRRHIACVWRLTDDAPAGTPQTIYPDGRCELLVHLAPPPECWDMETGWLRQAPTLFAAQRLTAVRLRVTQPLDCLGLRLRPAASGLVAGASLGAHRDRIVDLAGIDRAFSRNLRAAMREFAQGNAERLWQLLARACARHELDARMELAAARLESSAGKIRIETAARAAGMSMRGFQIRFRQSVGTTPKEFARLMRLQATLHALDGDTRLSDLAADTGFSDQAHATRELQRVTGLTPARLRAELRRDREGDVAVRLAAAFVRGHAATSGR